MRQRGVEMQVTIFAWLSELLLICTILAVSGLPSRQRLLRPETTLISARPPLGRHLLGERFFDGLFPASWYTGAGHPVDYLGHPRSVATVFSLRIRRQFFLKVLNLCFDILTGVPSNEVGLFVLPHSVLHKHYSARSSRAAISSSSPFTLVLPYIIRLPRLRRRRFPATYA
jgi:hypothetical protein